MITNVEGIDYQYSWMKIQSKRSIIFIQFSTSEIMVWKLFHGLYFGPIINQATELVSKLLVQACYSTLMFLFCNSHRIFVTYFPVTKRFGSNNSTKCKMNFEGNKTFILNETLSRLYLTMD